MKKRRISISILHIIHHLNKSRKLYHHQYCTCIWTKFLAKKDDTINSFITIKTSIKMYQTQIRKMGYFKQSFIIFVQLWLLTEYIPLQYTYIPTKTFYFIFTTFLFSLSSIPFYFPFKSWKQLWEKSHWFCLMDHFSSLVKL